MWSLMRLKVETRIFKTIAKGMSNMFASKRLATNLLFFVLEDVCYVCFKEISPMVSLYASSTLKIAIAQPLYHTVKCGCTYHQFKKHNSNVRKKVRNSLIVCHILVSRFKISSLLGVSISNQNDIVSILPCRYGFGNFFKNMCILIKNIFITCSLLTLYFYA